MDEIIKSVVLQMPAVGILLIFVVRLYQDMRLDAEKASRQRDDQLMAIRELGRSIEDCLSKK